MFWGNFVDDPELMAWAEQVHAEIIGLWDGLGIPRDTWNIDQCIRNDLDAPFGATYVYWSNWVPPRTERELRLSFIDRMHRVLVQVLRDHGFTAAIEDPHGFGETAVVVVRDRVGECVPVELRRPVGRVGDGTGISREVTGGVARVVEALGWVPLPVADEKEDGPGVVIGTMDGRGGVLAVGAGLSVDRIPFRRVRVRDLLARPGRRPEHERGYPRRSCRVWTRHDVGSR